METLFKISNLGAGIIRERIRNTILMLILSPDMVVWPTTSGSCKNAATMGKNSKAATPWEDDIEPIPVKTQQVIGSDVYCGVLKHMGEGMSTAEFIVGSAQAANSLG